MAYQNLEAEPLDLGVAIVGAIAGPQYATHSMELEATRKDPRLPLELRFLNIDRQFREMMEGIEEDFEVQRQTARRLIPALLCMCIPCICIYGSMKVKKSQAKLEEDMRKRIQRVSDELEPRVRISLRKEETGIWVSNKGGSGKIYSWFIHIEYDTTSRAVALSGPRPFSSI